MKRAWTCLRRDPVLLALIGAQIGGAVGHLLIGPNL